MKALTLPITGSELQHGERCRRTAGPLLHWVFLSLGKYLHIIAFMKSWILAIDLQGEQYARTGWTLALVWRASAAARKDRART